jgi:hypothetical protein
MTAAVTPPGYCGYCTVPRQGSQIGLANTNRPWGPALQDPGPATQDRGGVAKGKNKKCVFWPTAMGTLLKCYAPAGVRCG